MKGMMANGPYNSCPPINRHLESLQDLFRHLRAYDIMPVGGDSIFIEFGHNSLADIMQQRRPDQIRITIGWTCLDGQLRMHGRISFRMVLRRLGRPGEIFELRYEPDDAMPPTGCSLLDLNVDLLIWFHNILYSGTPT
jgi:hypothetical protein